MVNFRTVLCLGAFAVTTLAGCTGKSAEQQSKRDADRVAMQIEQLTTQRNALKEELDRVRQVAQQAQNDLTKTQMQLEQDKATLARANSDLATARKELAAAQAQLADARAQVQTKAPATQPTINK
jgi:chromosome segregation ATPase